MPVVVGQRRRQAEHSLSVRPGLDPGSCGEAGLKFAAVKMSVTVSIKKSVASRRDSLAERAVCRVPY